MLLMCVDLVQFKLGLAQVPHNSIAKLVFILRLDTTVQASTVWLTNHPDQTKLILIIRFDVNSLWL